MRDVNADKAVLVARRGFSKKAKKKAERVGIVLCTAMSAASDLWNVGLDIQVYFQTIFPEDCEIVFRFALDAPRLVHVDDEYAEKIVDRFLDDLENERISVPTSSQQVVWKPSFPVVQDLFGAPLLQFHAKIDVQVAHFVGNLKDFPSTRRLVNHSEGSEHVFMNREDYFFNFAKYCKGYSDISQLPDISTAKKAVHVMPHLPGALKLGETWIEKV